MTLSIGVGVYLSRTCVELQEPYYSRQLDPNDYFVVILHDFRQLLGVGLETKAPAGMCLLILKLETGLCHDFGSCSRSFNVLTKIK